MSACPVCSKPMVNKTTGLPTLFVCPDCWWEIPTVDRMKLGNMARKKTDHKSKLEQVVRDLKAARE